MDKKVYVRLLTTDITDETKADIEKYLLSALSTVKYTDLSIGELKPYWKIESWGEVNIQFITEISNFEKIKFLLASNYESETADKRYSNIFIPHTEFVWISC